MIKNYNKRVDRLYFQSGDFAGVYLVPNVKEEFIFEDLIKDVNQTKQAIIAESKYFREKAETLEKNKKKSLVPAIIIN